MKEREGPTKSGAGTRRIKGKGPRIRQSTGQRAETQEGSGERQKEAADKDGGGGERGGGGRAKEGLSGPALGQSTGLMG